MEVLFYESHDVYVHGLPQALRRLGHSVTVWEGPPELERLQRYLQAARPKLVLTMGWTPMHGDAGSLAAIRQYTESPDALHVYWSTEDPIHTGTWTIPYLEQTRPDAVLTISERTVPLLERLGYAAAHMSFAADAELHRPAPGGAGADVVLVGTAYGEVSGPMRSIGLGWLLRPLLGSGLRVEVYGNFWSEARQSIGFDLPVAWLRRSLPFRAVPQVYSAAAIVLCPQNEPDQLTGRTFEVLGTGGGALLTPRTPGVLRQFEEGRHVLCTSSDAETMDLVRRYIADAGARRRMSAAAREEVLLRHTYDHRAAYLLDLCAGWGASKHRWGRVPPQATTRTAFLLPDETVQAEEGQLRLHFPAQPAPARGTLRKAELLCFSRVVGSPGNALCILQPQGVVLDTDWVDAPHRPYPYEDGWHRWDVRHAIAAQAGQAFALEVRAELGLSVRWEIAGGSSRTWLVQYNQRAFTPRIALTWDTA